MTDTLREKLRREVRRHRFMVTGCSDQPMCCSCQEGCYDGQGWMLTMTPDEYLDHIADAILADAILAIAELMATNMTDVILESTARGAVAAAEAIISIFGITNPGGGQ